MQHVFGTVEFHSGRCVRSIFVLVAGEERVDMRLLVARALLRLRLSAQNGQKAKEFAFLQYMK